MLRPNAINGVEVPVGVPVAELVMRVKAAGSDTWSCVEALGRHESSDAFDSLLEFAASKDWGMRRASLEALAVHARCGEAGALFREALTDESQFVVTTACAVLGRLETAEAHDDVCRLLGSGDEEIRGAAVKAIGQLWTSDDFERILGMHEGDPSEAVRREAAWVLWSHADPSTWCKLADLWRAGALPRYRVWACELAGDYGLDGSRDMLRSLAEDPDGHVRKAATAALGRLDARLGSDV